MGLYEPSFTCMDEILAAAASDNSPPTIVPSTNGYRPPAPTFASKIAASLISRPTSQTHPWSTNAGLFGQLIRD